MIVDICSKFDIGTFLMWTPKAIQDDPKKYRPNKILVVEADCLIEVDIVSGEWQKHPIPALFERTFVKLYDRDNQAQYDLWSAEMKSWLTNPPQRNLLQSKTCNVYDYDLRRKLSKTYCFAMPSNEVIETIKKECTTEYLLELGSGTGYWAAILENHGQKVIATDISKPYDHNSSDNKVNFYWQYAGYFKKTEQISGQDAVVKYPNYDVLMVWPSEHGQWPWYALRRIQPGRKVFVISEGIGGCCGCDRMFSCLKNHYTSLQTVEMPHWPFIYDYMEIFERNNNVINWKDDVKMMSSMAGMPNMAGMPMTGM